jgi:c-di-GMP-binding flagellar brake protein YcgR
MKMEKRRAKPHIGIAKFEKRKHPRFLLNLPIEYYRINSDLDPDLTPAGYTFNASEGGLMVNLPEQMDIGQYLRMKLFFSFGPDINAIEMLSQVMWTDNLGEDGSYRSGVRFVEISSEDMGRLKNFLQDLSN